MGHLVQMTGLTVQNFVSAAVGMAVAVALVRGFARASHRPDRQLLGRPDPRRHPRPAADLVRRRDRAGGARRDDEPARGRGRHRRRRRVVDDRAGAHRLAGGDQGAGHERRRDLQRQLRAPVREPERADQPAGDLPAAGHPGLPDPRVRRHGARHPAGPRPARRDGRAVGRAARRRVVGRDAPERSRRRSPRARRWRARRSGSGSRRRCCSRCRPPARRPARSTRCTTPTRAWAAGSPC